VTNDLTVKKTCNDLCSFIKKWNRKEKEVTYTIVAIAGGKRIKYMLVRAII
jgi:hypothetical protein